MAAAEELQPQQSMLEDASPTPTAAGHDAMSDGEPSDDGGAGDDSSKDSSSLEDDEVAEEAEEERHRASEELVAVEIWPWYLAS